MVKGKTDEKPKEEKSRVSKTLSRNKRIKGQIAELQQKLKEKREQRQLIIDGKAETKTEPEKADKPQ